METTSTMDATGLANTLSEILEILPQDNWAGQEVEEVRDVSAAVGAVEPDTGLIKDSRGAKAGEIQLTTLKPLSLSPSQPAVVVQPLQPDIQSMLYGFGGQPQQLQQQQMLQQQPILIAQPTQGNASSKKPWVEIIEQPRSKSLRFRYECEGKGAGALQGVNSTLENKTYPKIKVHNFKGFATVVVSCVTHNDEPAKSHPHKLVSPATVTAGACEFGICTQVINADTMEAEFPHLGIQCVKKPKIADSLKLRKEKKVDPCRAGWKHLEDRQEMSKIDLNAVRLCFHVWYEAETKGKCTQPMPPVCSNVIYDTKSKKDLQICSMSDEGCSVRGDKKIILLCEKVSRDDIQIRFSDDEGWEGFGIFTQADVHKQYAISFHPPKYPKDIKTKKRVYIELCKGKTKETLEKSEPREFYYWPDERNSNKGVPGSPAYQHDHLKNEFKVESPLSPETLQVASQSQQPKRSPYAHLQLGGEGNFILTETGRSDVSLTDITPTFNVVHQQHQLPDTMPPLTLSHHHLPQQQQQPLAGGGSLDVPPLINNRADMSSPPVDIATAVVSTAAFNGGLVGIDQQNGGLNSLASFCQPEQLNIPFSSYSTQPQVNGYHTYTYNNTDLYGGSLSQMDEKVNNLSDTIPQGMRISGDHHQEANHNPQLQIQQQQLQLQQQQPLQQQHNGVVQEGDGTTKGGKRKSKTAELESGSLVIGRQAAKIDEEYDGKHAQQNLSRQQSSLNTPTVSEQLSSASNIAANNFAGNKPNQF